MSLNITNKRYAIVQKDNINNKDIVVTSNGNYYAPDGYTGLGLVRVQLPESQYQEITISPKITAQTILPDPGYDAFSKIYVNPMPAYVTDDITINPKTTVQHFTPTHDGFYNVQVNAVTSDIDSNIKAENIVQGTSILGVEGIIVPSNETTRNITVNGTYTPPSPYTGFSEVVVDVGVILEELTIIPTTSQQVITSIDQFHGYSPITVNAVNSSIDANILPANIREGVTILGVEGTLNTVKNTTLTVTPAQTTQTFSPSAPYTGYSVVTVNGAPTQSKTLTVNSSTSTITTITPDSNYTGLSSVKVDLTWILNQLTALNAGDADTTINLQNKTFSSAGTYTCDAGYDGLGTVTIDLSWVDQAIAQAKQGTPDGTGDQLIAGTATKITSDANQVRSYGFYYSPVEKVVLTSATSIGAYAFAYSNIKTLTISTPQVCQLYNEYSLPSTITKIYVPSNLVTSYRSADYWSLFSNKILAIS